MELRPESVMAQQLAAKATETRPSTPCQEADEVVAAVSLRSAAAAQEAQQLISQLPLGTGIGQLLEVYY